MWTKMCSNLLELVWKRCGSRPSRSAGNQCYLETPKCNIFTQWRTGSERLLNAFWTPLERVRVSTGTPTGLNGPKCWLFYTLVRIDTGKFRVRTGPYGFVRFSKEIKTIECKIPAKIVSGGRFSVLDPVNVRLESSATVFGTKRFG